MSTLQLSQDLAAALTASGASSVSSVEFAAYQDSQDRLSSFRDRFSFPTVGTVAGKQSDAAASPALSTYLAGNSLGLMPKSTPALIAEELKVWSQA